MTGVQTCALPISGDLFEKLPTISTSAPKLQHRIGVKKAGARVHEMLFLSYRFILDRSPINSLKICQKKRPEIVEGITKTLIRAPREFKTGNIFQTLGPKSWRVLQKQQSGNSRNSINGSQRQSTAVNRCQGCQAKWCTDRVPEPPFFTRRGPR